MHQVICIGSAGQDIFFPMSDVEIYNTPEDLMAQKHMLLELGAKYRVSNRYEAPGGGAMNAAIGLARLGIKSVPHAALGDDAFADAIEGMCKDEGISKDGLKRIAGAQTDVSCVLVDTKSADRTIVYNRDTNERFRVDEAFLRKGQAFFVSGISGSWRKNMEVILRVVKQSSKRLFYNPSQRDIASHPEQVMKVVALSEGLFVNKDEAIEIAFRGFGNASRDEVADETRLLKDLLSIGPKVVVLTDGSRGAWAFDGERIYSSCASSVGSAVDSTGAGDAFTSAFLSGYLQGKDTIVCLKRGIVNGGSVVGHYGALAGLLRSHEITPLTKKIEVKIM